MPTVLIVDDETPIREMIKMSLELSGFNCLEADSSKSAMPIIVDHRPDIILLDWMMPEVSGLELLRRIRRDSSIKEIPVILLTAKIEEQNSVQGLDAGADDYIRKPFSSRELLARIKSVLRRSDGFVDGNVISSGSLSLDPLGQRVFINGDPINIGPTEYKLLKFFMTHQDRVYTRGHILDQVWGANVFIEERTIDVHIRRLRKILKPKHASSNNDDPSLFVQTVRGSGYRFSSKVV
ncbi:MAG: phosphate regulon transcriptional regulator PhoB [Pseudomonadota bacterium]|nr:phosphate regulon transcriptional regulator PhoB [Pseudomonadota bacterium]